MDSFMRNSSLFTRKFYKRTLLEDSFMRPFLVKALYKNDLCKKPLYKNTLHGNSSRDTRHWKLFMTNSSRDNSSQEHS